MRKSTANRVVRPKYTFNAAGEPVRPRYSKDMVRAKGNPFDVPWEIVSREVKRAYGSKCHRCGLVNNFNRVELKDTDQCDSFDNLRVVCREHAEDQ